MEDGILKLNQEIVPELILSECPGAITLRYAVDSIKDLISDHHNSSERTSVESASDPDGKSLSFVANTEVSELISAQVRNSRLIWAVDISKTFMRSYDLEIFAREILTQPELSKLQVLIVSTVFLNDESWDDLLPILSSEYFQHLDVCGTFYSNKRIFPILQRGKANFSTLWLDFSLKLIFSDNSYCKILKNDVNWIQLVTQRGLLHEDWDKRHKIYYQTLYDTIKQARPLNLLTGDSDVDKEFEEADNCLNTTSFDELSICSSHDRDESWDSGME